ncbi:PAS domain S-box protein, partial [Candidatus Poribacteria bacterium]|nr:PAS domain S-box protein [Candidatus Poribacteria bacterium]
GRRAEEILPPDLAASIRQVIHETLADGGIHTLEYQLDTRIGRRAFEARVVKLDDDTTLSIVRDITASKRAALVQQVVYEIADATSKVENLEALCWSIRDSLGKVVETSNFHIMAWEADHNRYRVIFDTDEYDHATTFSAEELSKGLGAFVIRTGEPLLLDGDQMDGMTSHGEVELIGTPCESWMGIPLVSKGVVTGVVVVQSYTPDTHYTEEDKAVLSFVSGQIAYAIERKQAENERLRLAAAVEHAADTVIITDQDGVIQYVNPTFVRTTGYAREDAIGQTMRFLRSGVTPDEIFSEMWRTIKAGQVWQGTMTNRRRDGKHYEEEATISPVPDSSGRIVAFVEVRRPRRFETMTPTPIPR